MGFLRIKYIILSLGLGPAASQILSTEKAPTMCLVPLRRQPQEKGRLHSPVLARDLCTRARAHTHAQTHTVHTHRCEMVGAVCNFLW